MLKADWDNFMDLLADDVVFMPPDEPPVEGKDEARAWVGKFPPVKAMTAPVVRIEGRDDFACMRGDFTWTLEPEPGKPVSMKGKWFANYRKQPMALGEWPPTAGIGRIRELGPGCKQASGLISALE